MKGYLFFFFDVGFPVGIPDEVRDQSNVAMLPEAGGVVLRLDMFKILIVVSFADATVSMFLAGFGN
jgi:hypothetical protein